MSDWSTPEQVAADEALTAAIAAVDAAYNGETPGVLVDYVVIFQRQDYDEDGSHLTPIGISPRDGDQPLHRTIGLVEYARTRLALRVTSGG